MESCPFCNVEKARTVEENSLFFAVRDKYPVTPLHTLLIPFRHVDSYFELSGDEISAFNSILHSQRNCIQDLDDEVSGFNVGFNAGRDAGQTVSHAHVHVIPRRLSDAKNPEGGVRGVIPKKQKYL